MRGVCGWALGGAAGGAAAGADGEGGAAATEHGSMGAVGIFFGGQGRPEGIRSDGLTGGILLFLSLFIY